MSVTYHKGYLAIWRPVGVKYWFASGFSAGEFKDLAKTHFDDGHRMVCFDYYSIADSYSGVWHEVAGGTGEHFGPWLDFDEFKDADDTERDNKGRRLMGFEVDGGEVMGLWRTGTFSYHWELGLSADAVKTNNDEQVNNKHRRVVSVTKQC